MYTFMSVAFFIFRKLDTYQKWLREQDHTPAYLFYKKILQLLLWKTPGKHLVLKDPNHLE